MTPYQREVLDTEAHKVVFGAANGRLRDNIADVTVLLASYSEHALELEVPLQEAWALLFGAAVTEFTDAVEDLADEHGMSPSAELADRALAFQMDLT